MVMVRATMKICFLIFNLIYFVQGLNQLNNNSESLKLVQILFRHGERSPSRTYKNDPYKNYSWPGGYESLSNDGRMQMYNVGLKLRKLYSSFLPVLYFPQDLSVYSSYSDRCLMSAQLVLAGLYPPVGEQIWNKDLLWQPIPVKYNPRHLDNLIVMKQPCEAYEVSLNKSLTLKVNMFKEKYPELLDYLTEHTGNKIETCKDIELLFETLESEEKKGLMLPSWVNKYYPEPLKTLATEGLYVYSETPLMKKLTGGVFLKNITDSMLNKIQNKTQTSMVLFSGHDLTIVSVLNALQLPQMIKPEFASTLIFELHSQNDKSIVKILFMKNDKEKAQEIEIPGCPSPCVLEVFLEVLQPMLPNDWNKECSNIS